MNYFDQFNNLYNDFKNTPKKRVKKPKDPVYLELPVCEIFVNLQEFLNIPSPELQSIFQSCDFSNPMIADKVMELVTIMKLCHNGKESFLERRYKEIQNLNSKTRHDYNERLEKWKEKLASRTPDDSQIFELFHKFITMDHGENQKVFDSIINQSNFHDIMEYKNHKIQPSLSKVTGFMRYCRNKFT